MDRDLVRENNNGLMGLCMKAIGKIMYLVVKED